MKILAVTVFSYWHLGIWVWEDYNSRYLELISGLVFIEWVFCSLVSASSLVLKSVAIQRKPVSKKKKCGGFVLPGGKCFWDPGSCSH